jgi:hypothetical protein
MSDIVETQSPELAYVTKSNILVPPEAAPTAAHLTALEARALARRNDGSSRPVTASVKSLKKG